MNRRNFEENLRPREQRDILYMYTFYVAKCNKGDIDFVPRKPLEFYLWLDIVYDKE